MTLSLFRWGIVVTLDTLLKEKKYSYENELRVSTLNIVFENCLNADGTEMSDQQKQGPGMYDSERKGIFIKTNVNTVIRKIIVSPKSPPWFKTMIEILTKRHKIEAPVRRSKFSKE